MATRRNRSTAGADAAADRPEQAPDEPAGPPDPTCWEYTGPQRLYSNVPVTVRAGDVVAWVGAPADDGCWAEHDGPATVRPDNEPTDQPEGVSTGA